MSNCDPDLTFHCETALPRLGNLSRMVARPLRIFRTTLILLGSVFLSRIETQAQTRVTGHNFNGWLNYFGNHQIGDSRWGIYAEGQVRRHNVVTQWQQILLRPGLNFTVNKYLTLTTGYAFIHSWPYGDFRAAAQSSENRIWHQGLLRYNTGKVSWVTRVRFENRFLSTRYENRIRFWQQARIPISRKYYVNAVNEVWIFVKPYVSSSAFDQNRAFLGLGRIVAPWLRVEAGYLNHTALQRSGRVLEMNHTIMVSLHGSAAIRRSRRRPAVEK